MKKFWRNNSLSIVLLTIFLVVLVGQTFTGYQVNNKDLEDHGQPTVSMPTYLTSGHFGEAVFENWESEFLQMAAYVFLTIFLFQKGSAESKDPSNHKKEEADSKPEKRAAAKDAPWPVRKGGLVLKIYRHSLLLAFVLLFLFSFAMHAVEGSRQNCSEGVLHQQECETFKEYVTGSQFWFESFQNWQSEFLAVGSIVVLSIFLRQQGSPESKPVAAPNSSTG
jgi:hypothetical protein